MDIKQLYEKVCEKRSIHKKLEELYSQQSQLNGKMELLKTQYEKEQKDVDRLENGTLASFFYNMAGKLDEKLDKETREMFAAKGIYDSAVFQLNNVNADIIKYEKQLAELSGCEERYEAAVKAKLEELKGVNPEIVKLQTELAVSRNKIREIKEALQAGDTAYTKAQQVAKELGKADNWAAYDVFGGGLIADIVKYDHIDNSQRLLNEMYSCMAEFKTELSDINMSVKTDVTVDGLLMAADYFFDNIFTDFAVKNKISEAISQIDRTIFAINEALYNLREMEKTEIQKSEQLRQKLEIYVTEL